MDRFLKNAPATDPGGRIVALIAPHAGYAYSGPTAAAAYRQIQGHTYDAVVVLAPSHREYFRGASVYARGSYRTPLGLVPVDADLAEEILSQDSEVIRDSPAGHRVLPGSPAEHSLELQLPFLQRVLPELKIVPIVVGDYTLGACRRIADALARCIKSRNVLLVASSDLYHGESDRACVKTDTRTLDRIRSLDAQGLARGLEDGSCQACGSGPILIALMAAERLGADRAELLARTNSNAVTGKKGGYVVGYGAVALLAPDSGLPEAACHELLRIARDAMERATLGESASPLKIAHPALGQKRGAFVTLTRDGRLRGCIGYLYPILPLALAVQEMAVKAALHDQRFPPVKPDEAEDLRIEISVLSPLRQLSDVSQIEVGRHGLLIQQETASGVLLPQVPVEYGWDSRTFLEEICVKAGLPRNAWRHPETRLWTFEAEVFAEQ